MTKSGAAASALPRCRYFEQMAFLHEKTTNRPTDSNLTNIPAYVASANICISSKQQSGNTQLPVSTTLLEFTSPNKHPPKRNLTEDLFTPNRHGNKMNKDVAELMLL